VAARDVVVVGASAGWVEALRDGDLVRFRCRVGPSWGDVARDDEYVDCLQLHPDEFTALFNTILINVTNFLPRQRRGEQLRTQLLPELLHRRGPTEPIRLARTRLVGSPRRTPWPQAAPDPGPATRNGVRNQLGQRASHSRAKCISAVSS
jgi:hypothetical protein